MLTITIPAQELWDEKNQMFIETKECTICLEHSLVSVSKWESKWHKPFISGEKKSEEEIRDYIRCMTITQNVDPSCYNYITNKNLEEVNKYIDNTMTATTFQDNRKQGSKSGSKRDVITSEVIYYWMISCQIPFECQKWHLNRLLTLIKICHIKNNNNDKKMSKGEILSRNHMLNEARKKQFNTRG